jgi:hypothetical protein
MALLINEGEQNAALRDAALHELHSSTPGTCRIFQPVMASLDVMRLATRANNRFRSSQSHRQAYVTDSSILKLDPMGPSNNKVVQHSNAFLPVLLLQYWRTVSSWPHLVICVAVVCRQENTRWSKFHLGGHQTCASNL